MEITGVVTKVTKTYIRLQTIFKKQNIDVFYPESKERAVFYRFQEHMVTTLEIEPQEVDIDGLKYAKLWFKYVLSPIPLDEEDYSDRLSESPSRIISILYKKDA
ncbi:hypothetical protein [Chryseobacterium sp.]|uniref:hypothetical protein n=1 Tax=Chryseobacterium sp. TaxID=1871047 RepID=UPI0024E22F30|nr:hypothetical protein [Chryseobacterium sp.]